MSDAGARPQLARARAPDVGWARIVLAFLAARRARSPTLLGVEVGICAAALAALLQFGLLGASAHKFPFLAFYPCVALSALLAGIEGGVVAMLASAAFVHFFFMPIESRDGVIALGAFFAGNFVVATVCEMLHRATARARRLDAANMLQASLSGIVQSSLEAIYSVDTNGIVLSWNAGAERLYGYSAQEMLGRSVARLAPRSAGPDLARLSDLARRGEAVTDFETERKHKSGAALRVELTASPIRNASGEPIGMSVVARDISERRRTEEALRTALLRVEAKFQNAAVGMADVGVDGRWMRVNDKLCAIVGYDRDELEGANFVDITHPQDVGADLAHVKELLAGRTQTFALEKRYIRKDGSVIWANLTVGKVHKPDGSFDHFLSIIEDITQRKTAEGRIRLLTAEVNHRANNLLAVVQSIAQQTAGSNGDTRTYVANLRERIQGLAASQRLLVDNEWRGTDLAALVRAQLAMFQDLVGGRILLDGPPTRLNAAAAQGVGMALHELATNAAKYGALSNDKGRVLIDWSIGDGAFRLAWREEGGPPVEPPTRHGFGRMVLGRMAEAAVRGKSETEYPPGGICWTLIGSSAAALENDAAEVGASNP